MRCARTCASVRVTGASRLPEQTKVPSGSVVIGHLCEDVKDERTAEQHDGPHVLTVILKRCAVAGANDRNCPHHLRRYGVAAIPDANLAELLGHMQELGSDRN